MALKGPNYPICRRLKASLEAVKRARVAQRREDPRSTQRRRKLVHIWQCDIQYLEVVLRVAIHFL